MTHNTFIWMISIEPSPSITMPELTREIITIAERNSRIDSSTEHYRLLHQIAELVLNEMCLINITPTVKESGTIQILFCMTNEEWKHLESLYMASTTNTQKALSLAIEIQTLRYAATRVVYTHCRYDADSSGCTFYFRVKS